MTKEEFLSIISSEIEKIEKDYPDANEKRIFSYETRQDYDYESEIKDYQEVLLSNKLKFLKKIIKLPALARIEAMSVAEVENYRKSKIEKLELKVKETNSQEEQEKLRWQQECFRTMPTEAVKYHLKEKIDDSRSLIENRRENYYLHKDIEKVKNSPQLSKFDEILASVAPEPEKAYKMSSLLKSYRNLSDQQKTVSVSKQTMQDIENRKSEIIQQIKELGGENYKNVDINDADIFDSSLIHGNLNKISHSYERKYEKDIATKVAKEAQNQADIKEAELRGITVEQLLQMKKQTQAMSDESMEMPEEEISHGMKR